MKLISLNTYGGRFFESLISFIKDNAATTDFFCFQEVLDTPDQTNVVDQGARLNLFFEMQQALPNHDGFFAPSQSHFNFAGPSHFDVEAGLALFVRKNYPVRAVGDFFIYRERNTYIPNDPPSLPHNAQYVTVELPHQLITICNVHGMAEAANKLDTRERLAQSHKILNYIKQQPGEKIITGDFNLLPTTKSVAVFEERGFRNLVKDFKITSTRGSLLKKLHPEYEHDPGGWQEFADYTFISSGVIPLHYTVPDIPVSDHLPLILEFAVDKNT